MSSSEVIRNLLSADLLPYSLDAEQSVLGCILKEPSCLSQVSMILKVDYFYLPQHKAIYSHILALDASKGGSIDPLTVLESLKNDELYDDKSGKLYLAQLAAAVPSVANVESYCEIVREKYYLRTLVSVAAEILEEASAEKDTADALLDSAEQKIYDIRQSSSVKGPARFADILPEVYERLYEISSPEREKYMGLKTGFEDLDRVITGLNKSDLIIIGARPSMGKTSFALNLARNVSVKGRKRVLFFSLEMSREQLAQRLLSTEARVPSTKMRTGNFTPDEWENLTAAAVYLSEYDIYFDDTSNITVPEMKARIRRLKNIDCVFIDYLQLMQSAKKTENRVQEVSEITRSLKLMAKDLKIPVITCAQLSRGTDSRGAKSHKPQLSDLRESGSIEQDADIVMMLYREDYYKNADSGDDEAMPVNLNRAQVLVQKNRHGPTERIDLNWSPEFTLFTSIERNYDDNKG
ncbi:MAG TPA: replicative DNA helicase [Clostridiales bacterium]|nr:replicative DNA helicase [Clostridiales bacterium]